MRKPPATSIQPNPEQPTYIINEGRSRLAAPTFQLPMPAVPMSVNLLTI
jgi:hypothetical protein